METGVPNWLTRYRVALGIFIAGLVLSGISALPLRWELSVLHAWFGRQEYLPPSATSKDFASFITGVHVGIEQTYARFPFFGYGTDWLGFGHFVIVGFFILPFRDPIRYRGVLKIGLAACGGVIVLALICGPIRQLPFFWTLIDCSFGVFGALPLLYCLRISRQDTHS